MYSVRARRPADALPRFVAPTAAPYSKTQGKALPWWAARHVALYLAASGAVGALLVCVWIVAPVVSAWRALQTPDFPSEMTFEAGGGVRAPFGSLLDPPSVSLTVVVPAFNEAVRLPVMLDEMLGVLNGLSREAAAECEAAGVSHRVPSRGTQLAGPTGDAASATGTAAVGPAPAPPFPAPCSEAFTWEIIVVDDGSTDSTVAVAESYLPAWGPARLCVLRLHQTLGKGGAVRKGVLRARGAHVLVAAADGAIEAKEVRPLLAAARRLSGARKDGAALVVGSRAHLLPSPGSPPAAKHTALQRLLGGALQAFVGAVVGARTAGPGGSLVSDPLCGFKIFSRHAAQLLLPALHSSSGGGRWAFDAELLVLAAGRRIPIAELPVAWRDAPGSPHAAPVLLSLSEGLQLSRDALVIRVCYGLGLWADALPAAFLAAALERGVHPSGAAVSRFDEQRRRRGGGAGSVGPDAPPPPRLAGAAGEGGAAAGATIRSARAPPARPAAPAGFPVYRDALYRPPPTRRRLP